MVEKLQKLIFDGKYMEARELANQMYEYGEQSENFWILNAAVSDRRTKRYRTCLYYERIAKECL